MTRDTHDVADPTPGHDPERAPHRPDLPVCPHCGGGPAVPVPSMGATVCKSCARVVVWISARPVQP
jgi:hypothetical protein